MVSFNLHQGDCREVLPTLPDNSIESICCDPPYHLKNPRGGFLASAWDSSDISFSVPMWQQCLRVLKPGGYLLAFGGARTYHRSACAIEDAGFEIRDQLMWLYADSAMNKSLNIAKAIDETSGVDLSQFGPWLREQRKQRGIASNDLSVHFSKSGGVSGVVRNWETGYGTPTPEQFNKLCRLLGLATAQVPETVLKVVGFKQGSSSASHFTPTADHSQRVKVPILEYQTELAKKWDGWGSNVSPAHEPICMARKPLDGNTITANVLKHGVGGLNLGGCKVSTGSKDRLPSNVIHDGSDQVLLHFGKAGEPNPSKFFYASKVGTNERNLYLPDGMVNNHPALKPISLCRYLTKLVTPSGGTVLDPFMGSGSMGIGAMHEGFNYVGIELQKDYFDLSQIRLGSMPENLSV